MSTKKITPRRAADPNDRGPLLGALLRLSHQTLVSRMFERLREAGYTDVEPSHTAALRPLWDHPEGVRATDLAANARITKQSMSVLVDHLDARGYVERVADPSDGRAKLVRLTRRGRALGGEMRALVRE